MSLTTFAAEVWNGSAWINVNDHTNYQVQGEALGEAAVQRRRIMASSPVVEGEFEVHSVRGNIVEDVKIWVYGSSHSVVSSNLVALENIFSQSNFFFRVTYNNSRMTWECFSADYAITRGQAFSHNGRALFSAQVPRLPAMNYEVV